MATGAYAPSRRRDVSSWAAAFSTAASTSVDGADRLLIRSRRGHGSGRPAAFSPRRDPAAHFVPDPRSESRRRSISSSLTPDARKRLRISIALGVPPLAASAREVIRRVEIPRAPSQRLLDLGQAAWSERTRQRVPESRLGLRSRRVRERSVISRNPPQAPTQPITAPHAQTPGSVNGNDAGTEAAAASSSEEDPGGEGGQDGDRGGEEDQCCR